jgi:ribonuclease P protein component
VLSPAHRLRTKADFACALRTGRRVPGRLLVLHLALTGADQPSRVGLAVGRSVGTSVVRHRVSRRLRHVLRDRVGRLPAGSLLVVRALPPAAAASSSDLALALDSGLATALTAGPARTAAPA